MLTDILKRVARRANMRYRGVDILRHTYCSHLAMLNAPVRTIQELAGHRDLSTTQRYMHLSPSAMDRAVELFESRPSSLADGGNILATAPRLMPKLLDVKQLMVSPEGIEPSTNRLRVFGRAKSRRRRS